MNRGNTSKLLWRTSDGVIVDVKKMNTVVGQFLDYARLN